MNNRMDSLIAHRCSDRKAVWFMVNINIVASLKDDIR